MCRRYVLLHYPACVVQANLIMSPVFGLGISQTEVLWSFSVLRLLVAELTVGPSPSSSCHCAKTTVPDAICPSLHLGLVTEGASARDMLADLNFFHHFLEGGTISWPHIYQLSW